METTLLKTVGQIAGIGGLAIGFVFLIFRDVLRKNIFPSLTKNQAYRIILVIAFLSWIVALAGIGAWVYTSRGDSSAASDTASKALENSNKALKEMTERVPRTIYPVVDLSMPVEAQLHLYPEDRVQIVGFTDKITEVWFGNRWEKFLPSHDYIVWGVRGTPITPQFKGSGHVKMEVSFTSNPDKQREVNPLPDGARAGK